MAMIAQEVIGAEEELSWIPRTFSIGYLESTEKKHKNELEVLGECIKVKELYKPFVPHDFLIVFYVQNCHGMSDEQLRMLMHHELLHVGITEKGDPYVVPHDVEDFWSIIDRYGRDWSKRS